jgi:hypothetical protein
MHLFLVITEHSLHQLAKTKYIVEEYIRFLEKCTLGMNFMHMYNMRKKRYKDKLLEGENRAQKLVSAVLVVDSIVIFCGAIASSNW